MTSRTVAGVKGEASRDRVSVLEGIRVLEVASWAFVPAAGAVLAAWGAEVTKIEPLISGDPIRGLTGWGVGPETGPAGSPLVQIFNRGKQSISVDLTSAVGYQIMTKLVARADIFLTNFLPATRRKLRIDVHDIRALNDRIIYGRGSGQGPRGADSEKGGFDSISYWSRSGAARGAMRPHQTHPTPLPGPAFGDSQSGLNLAGALAAALFHRERTGQALTVDISLLSSGMWSMQPGITSSKFMGVDDLPLIDRHCPPNPLANEYSTSDGHYIALAMLEGQVYWPRLCRALDRYDLISDPRFSTTTERFENRRECVALLDQEFAKRALSQAVAALSREKLQWDVVQPVSALETDPQVIANEYVGYLLHDSGDSVPFVRVPGRFDETPEPLAFAPEHGANTEEVLLELGYSWDDILRFKDCDAIN